MVHPGYGVGRLRRVDREPLEGIAAADERLGRPMPLPALPLPLVRWVEVVATGADGVEVEWNLDDTRGGPGRLALWAGAAEPADRGLPPAQPLGAFAHRFSPLEEAEPSLRPVHELLWSRDGLWLRLTAQGPWELDDLVRIAESVGRSADRSAR
jgi:hypothetical protein